MNLTDPYHFRWCKIDPDGPGLCSPAMPNDVGWDLVAALDTTILPQETVDVPTNVRIAMSPAVWAEIRARSSIARRGLQVDAGVVDPDYRGPLWVLLRNMNTTETVQIEAGERIGQVVFHKVAPVEGWQVDPEMMPEHGTARGALGFGASGRF